MDDIKKFRKELRNAVAEYIRSEGCSCCQDIDKHNEDQALLAKLLKVPMYDDKSGYNFGKFENKK